jgi:hypothetical protein
VRDAAETLLTLATDPPVTVRAAVAMTPVATAAVKSALAGESDARGLLGRLPESIAGPIARTAGTGAIAALLWNRSAATREATLDALIANAAAHREWHEKLRAGSCVPDTSSSHAAAAAQGLAAAGRLDEAALLQAAQRGEARLCSAILALAAGLPASSVDRAVTLRSAKGVVSLVWKAGFTMRAAEPLQELLGRVPPWLVLHGTSDGDFPLTIDEMRWQIEFLTRASGYASPKFGGTWSRRTASQPDGSSRAVWIIRVTIP